MGPTDPLAESFDEKQSEPGETAAPNVDQLSANIELTEDVKVSVELQAQIETAPVASLETTDEVKSTADVTTVTSPSPVATASTLDSAALDISVSIPKRRTFRPHFRPVHLPVKVHTFDSFRYRDYRFIWGATASFSGAFWLQVVVIGWLTYSLTESALLTSIAMGLDALPILLIGPFGGVLVDSWDRRKLLIFAYGYQMVLTLSFSAIVFLDILQPWHIFGFIFMMGISWVVNDPARMSLISTSVPRHHLVNAFALNSMAFSVTRLIAPAVGGAVLAFWGPGPALIVQAILQLGAVVSAYPIRATQANRAGLRLNKALSGIMEGVRYISKEPVILGLVALSGIPSVLVMPFIYGLLPVYAAEVFVVGPSTLGLLMASIGAGALVGTLVLASVGEIRRKGKVVVGCLALTGVGMLGFALNSSLAMAFPLIMVVSIGVMAFFSTASATIQSIVPDEFRGRVSGLYMLSFGFMPVGSVAAGLLAERFGGPGATVIGGGLVLLVLITLVFSFKAIWRLD